MVVSALRSGAAPISPLRSLRRYGPARSLAGTSFAESPAVFMGRRTGFHSMVSEATLRSAIENERAVISQLRDKVGDEPLNLLLQSASNTLAFALMGFLDPIVMGRTRTPAELESWLGQAARYLERATQIRKEVEEAAKPAAGGG
jgi:hypothetical protein